jgi:putative nucleotidyltransferase with HDIG domain
MHQLLIVGNDRADAAELTRQLTSFFQLEFQELGPVLDLRAARDILIQIDLDRRDQLLSLNHSLKRKAKGAKIIIAIDKGSRLQEARAFALGATDIIERPLDGMGLLAKFAGGQPTLITLPSFNGSELAPSIAAATEALRDIFSSALSGVPINPVAVDTMSDAILDQLEAQGLSSWLEEVRTHHSLTYQHCLLVTGIAVAFGNAIGLSREDRHRLSFAGMLHDIGKARIPLAILEKPGPLDDHEMAVMRTHPELGLEALQGSSSVPEEMLDIVVHHHEFVDGSGYPHGLKGREISDLVRVMTISDVFGALIERRSYKPPMSCEAAYQVLLDMGPKLDKDLVRAFEFASRMDARYASA